MSQAQTEGPGANTSHTGDGGPEVEAMKSDSCVRYGLEGHVASIT